MSSLLTNPSAMTALAALTQTQSSLNQVENQISTGKRIASAADNASYWSIATKMESNVGALGSVNDALSESASLTGTMSAAMSQAISVVKKIKNDLVEASNPGADLKAIQSDIAAQQSSLLSIGESANFNGQNWLATTAPGNVSLVASYDSTNGVSFLTIDTTKTQLFNATVGATQGILGATGASSGVSILSMNIGAATAGDLANMLKDVETAIGALTTAGSILGSTTTNITTQQTYVSNLSDSLTTGVGSLVDANMNEAATKLAALQVQQQLGIQALGIANSNTQLILKLFQ